MSSSTARASRLRRAPRRFLAWLLGLKGSPQQISLGLAIGVFVGFSPFWGLHMLIAAALATLCSANRPAALAAVWLSNPLTVIPVYTLTYRVGHAFVPGQSKDPIAELLRRVLNNDGAEWWNVVERLRTVFQVGEEVIVPLMIGGVLVGTFCGVLSYLACRTTLLLLPRRRRTKPATDRQP